MIRINLIAAERRPVKQAARSFQMAQKLPAVSSLVLVLAAVLIGWRYWSVSQHEAQLVIDIAAARREETRLAEVLQQVTRFEAQRAQLQQRVAIIDELRRGQTAPVHIVDQVSQSLPEMTWLVSLKQEGYQLTIEGRSTTLAALSDFVGNLEATRYFARPVEIVETEVVPGQAGGAELIDFTIKGTFQMSGIEPPVAAGGRGAAVAPGGKIG